MLRKILSVVGGITVGYLIVALFDAMEHSFFPPPTELDYTRTEELKSYLETLPASAYAMLLFGHVLGTFASGFIALKVSKNILYVGIIASGAVVLSTIMNLIMLPIHPVWFIIADIVLVLAATFTVYIIGIKSGNNS